jgi:sugar transferase (PEP-CTERM/EpsH1 system associated)
MHLVIARQNAKGLMTVISRPPLIVHIIYRLGIGGLENGLVNLINATPVDRYRHAIVCLAGYTDFAERITRKDTSIYDLQKSPGKDPGYYVRLFKLLRKLRPDIVHTRNIGTLECQFIAAAAGVKHKVHGEHGWEVGDLLGRQRKHVLLRRLSRVVISRYITVSRHMMDWLENVIQIPADRITQIYNGIDAGRFQPRQRSEGAGSFVVGTVGRLDPIKDQKTLLRAFAALLSTESNSEADIRLVIVGSGAMRQELEELTAALGLTSQVDLAGASDNVAALLKTFDLFVLPSLSEGISNTILEAMSSGLPAVVTNVGGNPELVVNGVTGTLFEPGDINALAGLMRASLEQPESRRQQGSAGRLRAVEEFGLNAMVDAYLGLYDKEIGHTETAGG